MTKRTIDKLHRETSIPMWALEIAFELSERGMLDEETMASTRVVVDAARVIAERSSEAAIQMRSACVEKVREYGKSHALCHPLRARASVELVPLLESLTLDQVEQEKLS